MQSPINTELLIKLQAEDPAVSKFIKSTRPKGGKWHQYQLVEGVLYTRKKTKLSYEKEYAKRLIVPRKLKSTTICHDDMSGGHQADLKTYEKVKTRYFWPNIRQDCEDWISSCTTCAKVKPGLKHRAPLQPIKDYPLEPFQTIGIDFVGQLT